MPGARRRMRPYGPTPVSPGAQPATSWPHTNTPIVEKHDPTVVGEPGQCLMPVVRARRKAVQHHGRIGCVPRACIHDECLEVADIHHATAAPPGFDRGRQTGHGWNNSQVLARWRWPSCKPTLAAQIAKLLKSSRDSRRVVHPYRAASYDRKPSGKLDAACRK